MYNYNESIEVLGMNDTELIASVKNTLYIESESVNKLIESVSEEAVIKAIKLIGDCKGRIVISGCGTSGAAAKKIAHSLCCIERPACFLSPSDAVHGALGLLQKEDILILISKGGNTGELVNLLSACQAKGAKLIGVTENPDSVIAMSSDILLKIKVDKEPCPFNMLATASTIAVIAVFDAICIALMHYTGYTREQFAIIHPKGAVGDRLLNNIK
jgi:KpsF/GutQ family protein